jgi:hypothetical protein
VPGRLRLGHESRNTTRRIPLHDRA